MQAGAALVGQKVHNTGESMIGLGRKNMNEDWVTKGKEQGRKKMEGKNMNWRQ